MGYRDISANFSTNQAITAIGDADSTNVLEFKNAGDMPDMYLEIQTSEAVESTGDSTINFKLQTSSDGSTYTSLFESGAIDKTSLGINTVPVKVKVPIGVKKYLKVVYTNAVAENTKGKFNAFLTPSVEMRP
jgi:hypothetical protein